MSDAKFTPGPWSYRPYEFDDWGVVRAPVTEQGQSLGGIICQARDPQITRESGLARHRAAKTDPWEANARLIAAAPELFDEAIKARAAFRTALADYEPGSSAHNVIAARIDTLDAAIAKALGNA